MEKLELRFSYEKETKNTIRYRRNLVRRLTAAGISLLALCISRKSAWEIHHHSG